MTVTTATTKAVLATKLQLQTSAMATKYCDNGSNKNRSYLKTTTAKRKRRQQSKAQVEAKASLNLTTKAKRIRANNIKVLKETP